MVAGRPLPPRASAAIPVGHIEPAVSAEPVPQRSGADSEVIRDRGAPSRLPRRSRLRISQHEDSSAVYAVTQAAP